MGARHRDRPEGLTGVRTRSTLGYAPFMGGLKHSVRHQPVDGMPARSSARDDSPKGLAGASLRMAVWRANCERAILKGQPPLDDSCNLSSIPVYRGPNVTRYW